MSGSRSSDDVSRVHVRCPGDGPDWLRHLEHGLEEEGVPWLVDLESGEGFDGDPVALAYAAATDSSLKIGLSVGDSRVVVHHKQLDADSPVFDVDDVTPEDARTLGSNAARLAKGTPLRPL
jgi:hypothetical protein